jgi:hypothetical protein
METYIWDIVNIAQLNVFKSSVSEHFSDRIGSCSAGRLRNCQGFEQVSHMENKLQEI